MASKPEKTTVFAFLGVNVVDEPYAMKDGELQAAQNAEFFRAQGRLALRSRAGLVSVAAVGLGAINGISAIPLNAPIIGTAANAKHRIYAALTTGWNRTTDAGATFAATTDLARTQSSPFAQAGSGTPTAWSTYVGIQTACQQLGKFFYVMTDGSTAVFLFAAAAAGEFPLARLTVSSAKPQPLFMGEGLVHMVAEQGGASGVFSVDPVVGLPTRLVATLTSPEVFTGGTYYQGRLWMVTALKATGARLLSARAADTAWNDESYSGGAATPVTTGTSYTSVGETTNLVPAIVGKTLYITQITVTTYSPTGAVCQFKDTGGTALAGASSITAPGTQTFSGAGLPCTADMGLNAVIAASAGTSVAITVVGYYTPTVSAPATSFTSVAHYAAAGATTQPRYLYMATFEPNTNAYILQRDYAGVFRIVLTSPNAGAGATAPVFYSHLTRYGTDLYVAYTKLVAGATTVCKIFKTSDGTTWTQEYDLFTNGGKCVAGIYVLGTDLFVSCIANAGVSGSAAALFRLRAGAWSKVSTATVTGPMGIL